VAWGCGKTPTSRRRNVDMTVDAARLEARATKTQLKVRGPMAGNGTDTPKL
jgi:hypothetical protein